MTTPTTPTNDREVAVSTFSFSVLCPCCGELVLAADAGFSATTVEVEACSARRAVGMVSVTMRKSAAYAAAPPATVVAHRDGLVVFA